MARMTEWERIAKEYNKVLDNYIELFFTDAGLANIERDRLRQSYDAVGLYNCADGWLVWADRRTATA